MAASIIVDAYPGQTFEGEGHLVCTASQNVFIVVTDAAVVSFTNRSGRANFNLPIKTD
jgi:hypothetical protein